MSTADEALVATAELVKKFREGLDARVKTWNEHVDSFHAQELGSYVMVVPVPDAEAICDAVDRLTAELEQSRSATTNLLGYALKLEGYEAETATAVKALKEETGEVCAQVKQRFGQLITDLKVAREESATMKRWFADSSAHAQEAVKVIDALKEGNAKLKRWFDDASKNAQEAVKEITKLRGALGKVAYLAAIESQRVKANAFAVRVQDTCDAALAPAPTQEVKS